MSERTTVEQIESVARLVGVLAEECGVITIDQRARMSVQSGSPTNGRSWRLYLRDPNNGTLHTFPGLSDGFLGLTRSDAWHTLHTMSGAYGAVRAARQV